MKITFDIFMNWPNFFSSSNVFSSHIIELSSIDCFFSHFYDLIWNFFSQKNIFIEKDIKFISVLFNSIGTSADIVEFHGIFGFVTCVCAL